MKRGGRQARGAKDDVGLRAGRFEVHGDRCVVALSVEFGCEVSKALGIASREDGSFHEGGEAAGGTGTDVAGRSDDESGAVGEIKVRHAGHALDALHDERAGE